MCGNFWKKLEEVEEIDMRAMQEMPSAIGPRSDLSHMYVHLIAVDGAQGIVYSYICVCVYVYPPCPY